MASSLASGIFAMSHDVRRARTRSRSRGRESTARSYVRSTSCVKATHAPLAQRPRFLLLVALLAPGCFSRPRDACNPEPRPGELGTICGFENPEDVEAVPAAGVVLVSEMRAMRGKGGGALAAVPLEGPPVPRRLFPAADGAGERGAGAGLSPVGDPGCTTSPRAETFSPHGITAVPTEFPGVTRVAVVGHRPLREAIELFDLTGTGADARLAWRGCVPLPDATVGNDVAFAADGEIVVSNFVPIMEGLPGLYYVLKGGLGRPTGDLIAWHPEHGWRHIPGTTAPTPNGVAVSADGAVVFYSQTGAGQVARVSRAGGAPEQTSVQGNPDNLSWSRRGTLLAATHTDSVGLILCVLGRHPCRAGWSLLEIDPQTLRVTERLHHDGGAIGGVASVTEVEGRYYLGSFLDDRIGIWRPVTTDGALRP